MFLAVAPDGLSSDMASSDDVVLRVEAQYDDDVLPGAVKPLPADYSKLVPDEASSLKVKEIGRLSKENIRDFITQQIAQHDLEMGLDDANKVEPHPLFYCARPPA